MTMLHIVAHQGGWDELVLFLIPAALAVYAIRWAERRSRRRAEQAGESESESFSKSVPESGQVGPEESRSS